MEIESQVAEIERVIADWNPWLRDPEAAFEGLPVFRRSVFAELYNDAKSSPFFITVTGPRRVGKSTLLRQIIQQLIHDGVQPRQLIYFSFDDPRVTNRKPEPEAVIEWLAYKKPLPGESAKTYLFLDEIQKLPRWELYLKKYYDLGYPIRIIASGSASTPIFRKSRESLVGRSKDYHLLPFSFGEYVGFSLQDQPGLRRLADQAGNVGAMLRDTLVGVPPVAVGTQFEMKFTPELRATLDLLLNRYFIDGGFPEVAKLSVLEERLRNLYDNQIVKVIYEDLRLAAEIRRPEQLQRFFLWLLDHPGAEISISSIAKDIGVKAPQIERYLPVLERTDMLFRVERFRKSPVRLRRGGSKFYLVDLALRNAVHHLTGETIDDTMRGLYAENLVFLTLRRWRGAMLVDYYRDKSGEVDFIVHTGPAAYLPIEVKYQNTLAAGDFRSLKRFAGKHKGVTWKVAVVKRWEHFGRQHDVICFPLPLFLLMFD